MVFELSQRIALDESDNASKADLSVIVKCTHCHSGNYLITVRNGTPQQCMLFQSPERKKCDYLKVKAYDKYFRNQWRTTR